MAYTKLFNSIVTSTIWTESDRTRIVWITMLACADKDGEVRASVPGLARVAAVPVDDCRAAIQRFLSPDPDSRTKDDEGRRIEEIDGGWSLLNFRKYRQMASKEDAQAAEASRKARYRARLARNVPKVPECPSPVLGVSTVNPYIAEAEADSDPSGSVPYSEQGAASAPVSRKRKPRGPRPPNAYEAAWYDTMRAHFRSEPAKLAPHGSIALGRLGKAFGAHEIAAKLGTLLADERLRKFATAKYLEEHWDTIAPAKTLFSGGIAPERLSRIKRVLARGEPPETDKDGRARWKIAKQEVVDLKITSEMLNGSH